MPSYVAKAYLDSFFMLFIVFDAIGNVPIFYMLTKDMDRRRRHRIFFRSVVIAGCLLIFFMFFGDLFLSYYKVTLDDFRIAGGILLLVLAVEGLLGRVEAEIIRSEDIAIFPMATPLMAGPGSIYTVIYLNSLYGFAPTLTSVILNVAFAWIILRCSDWILSKLGRNFLLVFSRIMAFLLAVIAVTMLREGVVGIASRYLK